MIASFSTPTTWGWLRPTWRSASGTSWTSMLPSGWCSPFRWTWPNASPLSRSILSTSSAMRRLRLLSIPLAGAEYGSNMPSVTQLSGRRPGCFFLLSKQLQSCWAGIQTGPLHAVQVPQSLGPDGLRHTTAETYFSATCAEETGREPPSAGDWLLFVITRPN